MFRWKNISQWIHFSAGGWGGGGAAWDLQAVQSAGGGAGVLSGPHCSVFTIFSMNIKDGIHYQYLPVSGLQKWIPRFICKKQKSDKIHIKLRIKTNRHSICSYQWPNTKISLVRWLVLLYLHDVQKNAAKKISNHFIPRKHILVDELKLSEYLWSGKS